MALAGVAALALAQRAQADVAAPSPAAPAAKPGAGAGAAAPPRKLNPTGRAISFAVPLRSNVPLGQVQITLTADDRLLIQTDDLVNAISRMVGAPDLDKIRAASTNGQVTPDVLAGLGYKVTFDPEAVELAIEVPLAARSRQLLNFGTPASAAMQADTSSPFAVFLNYRIGATYQISGADRKKWDVVGDFQLSGRLFDRVSFENFATLDTLSQHKFTRTASRLIYDLPGPAMRVTAGDLVTEATGLQASPEISGLNVSHLIDSFYPSSQTVASSSSNLVLQRDADVQIVVNGVPVSQMHLGPGAYDLRNLPVVQGANNVQAVVTDATGQRVVRNFSFFSDADLLEPGTSEYTMSVGVLAPFITAGPQYSNNPAASGFLRYGINQQLTLGANMQAAKYDQVLGVSAIFGTSLGLFSLDAAGNRLQSGQFGGSARFQYRFASRSNTVYLARTINLSVEYRSPYFLPLSSINNGFASTSVNPVIGTDGLVPVSFNLATIDRNSQALQLAGSVTQPISRKFSLQVNGNYTRNRDGFADTGSVSALMTYQAPFHSTVGLGITYQWIPKDNPGNLVSGRGLSFLLTLTHQFGAHATGSATADRFQQRATFSRSAERQIDDYYINADGSHNSLGSYGNILAGYETNRGDIQAVYNNSLDEHGHVSGQQAGALFTGSIAMAGGHIGLGRQISDAFAVVTKDPSLGSRQVLIQQRAADEPIARTGLFGPAVISLPAYNTAVVPYDVAELPPGYDLGDGNFQLYPWHHAGTALKVGSPYHMSALGTLADLDGKPVALHVGKAVSLTDPHAPAAEVITNRDGHFAALGLAVGTYRITITGDSALVYEMTVTKDPNMFVRVGTLQPVHQGR